MGIAVKLDYEFELNGQTYTGIGKDFADVEFETDVDEMNKNAEELKQSAICLAFDITCDEFFEREKEFKNAKFAYVEAR